MKIDVGYWLPISSAAREVSDAVRRLDDDRTRLGRAVRFDDLNALRELLNDLGARIATAREVALEKENLLRGRG